MLLNDVGTLLTAVRFQISQYNGCGPYICECWPSEHEVECVLLPCVLNRERSEI